MSPPPDAAGAEQFALLGPGGVVGLGWVPVEDVAWGTYGSVTGDAPDGSQATVTGYLVHSHHVRGGLGGGGDDQVAVFLADRPDTDRSAARLVYVDAGSVVTVLEPPPGSPAGVPAPWTRMPIEAQVLLAGLMTGHNVREVPGPANPLYQVDDDPPTALSRVADYLLDGGYLGSVGRPVPVPHPNRVHDHERQRP